MLNLFALLFNRLLGCCKKSLSSFLKDSFFFEIVNEFQKFEIKKIQNPLKLYNYSCLFLYKFIIFANYKNLILY